ncbi:hypothetical protein [Porphyromonas levii]|uniref:hypothetical protein n=1 Tax=Porphyromonas levii TaxID=28114 RepID=UPI001B8B9476|nr:hypothetical protein [Porphyromonas levii]MBR8713902.1 hypothetical protein [Porphyromonas levii]MBR8715932.1 hypothetical protein [Porphyromonas levii]MBR8728449.1 hypothetical protein [Porphyromonas levii]MBR8736786.1 hypothetical protein [Porphyromonas levii]MBR8774608.1 hypothetical protein [Porphyromonas levii]
MAYSSLWTTFRVSKLTSIISIRLSAIVAEKINCTSCLEDSEEKGTDEDYPEDEAEYGEGDTEEYADYPTESKEACNDAYDG